MFDEQEQVASIKALFPGFDDEVIWNAIFEKGYSKDGSYNPEKVVNYLLDLSNEKNNDNKNDNISSNNQNNPNQFDDSDDSDEEYDEKDENIFSQLTNLTFFNTGDYKRL
tara:strand:- start:271 stop:600 length:330 start_codon:yes stop_codon:yes gene_type:complete